MQIPTRLTQYTYMTLLKSERLKCFQLGHRIQGANKPLLHPHWLYTQRREKSITLERLKHLFVFELC